MKYNLRSKTRSKFSSHLSLVRKSQSAGASERSKTKRKARRSIGKSPKKVKVTIMENQSNNSSLLDNNGVESQSSENCLGFGAPTDHINPTAQSINQILTNNRTLLPNTHTGTQSRNLSTDFMGLPTPTNLANPMTQTANQILTNSRPSLPNTQTGSIPRNPWAFDRYTSPTPQSLFNVHSHSSTNQPRSNQDETNSLLKLLIEKIDKGFSEIRSGSQTQIPPAIPRTQPNLQTHPLLQAAHSSQAHPALHTRLESSSQPLHFTQTLPPVNDTSAGFQNFSNPNQQPHPISLQALSNQINVLTHRLNNISMSNSDFNPHREARADTYQTPPYKWSIRYNGDNNKLGVEDFLFQVETLQKLNKLTWAQVLRSFHTYLEGDVCKWYFQYQAMNSGEIDWNSFKDSMISAFGSNETDTQILGKMSNRFQDDKEPFQKFYQDLQSLRLRLTNSYSDFEMIQLIRTNARASIRQTLFTYQPLSLNDFITKCRQLDKLLNPALYQSNQTSRYGNWNYSNKKVSEVEGPLEDEHVNYIESLSRQQHKVCWNCDADGHNYIDCEKERIIFCYRCGLKNATTRNCSNCFKNQNFRQPPRANESPPPMH